MNKITEQPSRYDHLEQMSVAELLQHINDEDALVAEAVRQAMPQIQALVEAIEPRMKRGGRLFYVGAGTSGRLGVLDASELPPTFGISEDWVVGIIAGGDEALRHAVEKAEDDEEQGWSDVLTYDPDADDCVIGIAASGTTPYVVGAVRKAKENGLLTGCITSNPDTPLAEAADYPIETIVGRLQPYEERNGTEDGAQHDLHDADDPHGARRRQPDGEDATDERQACGSWYADDP